MRSLLREEERERLDRAHLVPLAPIGLMRVEVYDSNDRQLHLYTATLNG